MIYKLAFLPAVVLGSFTHTISLGTVIVGVLVTIGTLITMLFGVKYRVLADAQSLTISQLQADRDTWKDMAASTKVKLDEGLLQISGLKEEKARLESLPNLNVVVERMDKEAAAAAARHKEFMEALTGREVTK